MDRGPALSLRARGTLAAVLVFAVFVCGCQRQPRRPAPMPVPGAPEVGVTAYLQAGSPCPRATVELLRELELAHGDELRVEIVDIDDAGSGADRWRDAGFDCMAIVINGSATVSWGEGEDRRTVSFLHPAGFGWRHEDLREAIEAALAGRLSPAAPEEAEAVRLMDVNVRAQSVRVGDSGHETGQLVVDDRVVLEVTEAADDLVPGQRVTVAAEALGELLEEPFTPNQLRTEEVEGGVAVVVGDRHLLVATEADARVTGVGAQELAEAWRLAVHDALVMAALERSSVKEPEAAAG